MHILKIELKKVGQSNFYCRTSFSSSYEIDLLGTLLEDFGNKPRMEMLIEMLSDVNRKGLSANTSCIDRQPNGKIWISYLYADEDDDSHLEIAPNVLLKIIENYYVAREKTPTPKEIIIKLDENMENPIVETVVNLNPCTHDHDKFQ